MYGAATKGSARTHAAGARIECEQQREKVTETALLGGLRFFKAGREWPPIGHF
jgi:hypothetical protein